MIPVAPGLLLTTRGWPRYFAATSEMARATISVPPPGANPTTTSMGLVGNSCAAAGSARINAPSMTAIKTPLMHLRDCLFIDCIFHLLILFRWGDRCHHMVGI